MSKKLRFTRSLVSFVPLAKKSVQGGLLMGIGDFAAQTLFEKEKFNWTRVLQYTAVGTFFVTPSLSYWYRTLDKYVGNCNFKAVAKKVAIDQLIFAPTFIVIFMFVVYTVQFIPLEETKAKISNNYKDIVFTNYQLWPMVQIANFYFVPLEYQVLVVQSVAVLWNTYLSWKLNRNNKKEE